MSTDLEQQARELAEAIINLDRNAPHCAYMAELRAVCASHLQRVRDEGARRAFKVVQKMHENYCMNSESGMTDPETGERMFNRHETAYIETLEEVMEELRSAKPNGGKET